MILWHLGVGILATRVLFGRDLDYRWVILGLLAPDLIDKPIGRILMRNRFQSGRLIGHSLFLAAALVGLTNWMLKGHAGKSSRSKSSEAAIAGLLVHLGIDWIWTDPETALWPALGRFPAKPVSGQWWKAFLPGLRGGKALEEVLGAVALAWIYRNSILERDRKGFARTGRLFD